jgi:polysaccharide pyruvyl transferase WcaK-like protein
MNKRSDLKILLRLDAEYGNLGDDAINSFGIEICKKYGNLTIMCPRYEDFIKIFLPKLAEKYGFQFIREVDIIPDIFDIIKPIHFKNKILNKLEAFLNILSFLGIILMNFLIPHKSKNAFFKMRTKCFDSDIIVFSGGGYINEMWWKSTILPLLVICVIAKLKRIKTILGPSTIGPVFTRHGKIMIKMLLSLLDVVLVREYASYLIVKDIAASSKISLSKDWGYNQLFHNKVADHNFQSKPLNVCVHIRPWIDSLAEDYYRTILNILHENSFNKLKIVMMDKDEFKYIQDFIEFIKEYKVYTENIEVVNLQSYEEITENLTDCKLFIGMSFHFLLLAKFLSKPTISIIPDDYYFIKILGLRATYSVKIVKVVDLRNKGK